MDYEENQIQLNCDNIEYKINYVRSGHGMKGLLLLPGGMGTGSTQMKPQLEHLPKLLPNYSIIAWDPPGYGKSRPPIRTFPLDFLHRDASVANALMEALNFNEYSIIGFSNGGTTGLIMAAKFNDKIEKLIVTGAQAYIIPEEVEFLDSIRDVSKLSPKVREVNEEVYGVDYLKQLLSELIDAMIRLYDENGGDICKDLLKDIKAKTLIIRGAKDLITAPEHAPFLRKAIKNTEFYEFPLGKHCVNIRYAEEFNEVVSKFLLKD